MGQFETNFSGQHHWIHVHFVSGYCSPIDGNDVEASDVDIRCFSIRFSYNFANTTLKAWTFETITFKCRSGDKTFAYRILVKNVFWFVTANYTFCKLQIAKTLAVYYPYFPVKRTLSIVTVIFLFASENEKKKNFVFTLYKRQRVWIKWDFFYNRL